MKTLTMVLFFLLLFIDKVIPLEDNQRFAVFKLQIWSKKETFHVNKALLK